MNKIRPVYVVEIEQKSFSEWANDQLGYIFRMPIGKPQDDRIAQLQRDIAAHLERLGPQAREIEGFQVYYQVGVKGMLLSGARFVTAREPLCENLGSA